jgi:hypothetical protein
MANINDEEQKLNALFFLGGEKLYELHDTLAYIVSRDLDTQLKKAVAKLTNHFTPQRNTNVEQYIFCQIRKTNSETVEAFVSRLKLSSKYCDFDNLDNEIIKQVIAG